MIRSVVAFFVIQPMKNGISRILKRCFYSNAELIPVYVKLYEIRKDPLYKKVIVETIAQMEKNFMREGLYLSASDADSGRRRGWILYL